MSKTFEFGFAKEDITPAYGVPLCGYFNPRPNQGVFSRLSVKAAVFRTNGKYAAIVSYDLAMLITDFFNEVEECLKKENSPLYKNTLYCTTHTHTGPYTTETFGYDDSKEYMEELKLKTLMAITKAYKSLAPAELYTAETECSTLAFNRRYHIKGGKVLTNPGKLNPDILRPEGGIDPKIIMMEIRQFGQPVLLMANISNHTDTIGGNYVSADWPGAMEREIQNDFGYEIPVMTIIAPQGNINHFDVTTNANQTSYEEAKRIGKGYAHVILASRIRLQKEENTEIATAMTEFEAPYYKLSDEEYEKAKQIYNENKDAFMEEGRDFESQDIARGVPAVLKFFAERALSCRENPIPGKRIEKMLKISFGENLAIISLPAEPFIEIGEEIRKNSKYSKTVLAALGMGEVGYVGMPYHYGNDGYELRPSRGMADPSVGQSLIKNANDLLK